MDSQLPAAQAPGRTVWLSGAILTFLNKVVFPTLWLTVVAWLVVWALVNNRRVSISAGAGFIVVTIAVSTGILLWVTVHLQQVGYCGRELVIANYRREARVPFERVAAVEPVWWYRSRLVRIYFHGPTPFGEWVFYLPKWGPLRAMFAKPEEELRRLLWPRVPMTGETSD